MLRVGVITSAHGIKGEVKVFPTTDDAKRFKELKEVILDTGKEQIPMEIEHVKFFKNMVILKFKGHDDINEMEKYKSKDLLVVSDQGAELGTLKDVLETGANDVYVVAMKDGKELMLPAIGDCILDVDLEQGRMEVHVLEGLMDL